MTTTVPPHAAPPSAPLRPTSPVGPALLVVFGTLLGLIGLVVAGSAAAATAAMVHQRNGQFLTTPTERYVTSSRALTTTALDVLVDDQLPTRAEVLQLMVQATAADPQRPVFVGIGPRDDVAAYLDGVARTELASVAFAPFRPTYRQLTGDRTPGRPDQQAFWLVSSQGTGTQQIETTLRSGTWVVVVMNADAGSNLAVDLSAGARTGLLAPVALGLGLLALLVLGGAVAMLVIGASRLSPPVHELSAASAADTAASHPYPAELTGELQPLSRWLWLVKWFLAIPHILILAVLGVAVLAVTIVAAVAIVITGRYPRVLFDFTVGVLRWGWRVGFYASTAIGTDRYPPFTLARTDYPADFVVDYPKHLSRGLVLVKSWLLAIPHLIVVAVLTSPWYWVSDQRAPGTYPDNGGISLLGLLTLVAGVALLFTGRYPKPLFDLILGINRWVYRVLTYVLLLRDEYPPFRLDQGPQEPAGPAVRAPAAVAAGSGDRHPPALVPPTNS